MANWTSFHSLRNTSTPPQLANTPNTPGGNAQRYSGLPRRNGGRESGGARAGHQHQRRPLRGSARTRCPNREERRTPRGGPASSAAL
eukprot:7227392-Lingulodinium_polyedra.AAC.1